jgi:predicted nucleic acid-binding protein
VNYEVELIVDTDFVSNFGCVDRIDIIIDQYAPNIILIDVVENELKNPKIEHIYNRLKGFIDKGDIKQYSIISSSEIGREFISLSWQSGLGDGEAACLAYCKINGGILGSNNLSDIYNYCRDNNIKIITTADVLKKSFENKYITLTEGKKILAKMLKKERKIGYNTFEELLKTHKPIL